MLKQPPKELFPFKMTLQEWEEMTWSQRDAWNQHARKVFADGHRLEYFAPYYAGDSNGRWLIVDRDKNHLLGSNRFALRPAELGSARSWTEMLFESQKFEATPIQVPMTSHKLDVLAATWHRLQREQEHLGPCYCRDSIKCSFCEVTELLEELKKVIEPDHLTLHPDRLGNWSECIYHTLWRREQRDHLLAKILAPTRQPRTVFGADYVPPVSDRDAQVAATVIQWLGTSVGRFFIDECERAIKEARCERSDREFNLHRHPEHTVPAAVMGMAADILGRVIRADHPAWSQALNELAQHIDLCCKPREVLT